MPQMHVVERAFALAKTGACSNSREIQRTLKAEGYSNGDLQHLVGRTISRDLNRICKATADALPESSKSS